MTDTDDADDNETDTTTDTKAEIPTLPAYNLKAWGGQYWYVWCSFCKDEHCHMSLGYRDAKCKNPDSPYRQTGYILVAAPGEQPVHRLPWRDEAQRRRDAADKAAAIRWLKKHGLR